jgi:hypothetical protein
MRPNDAARDPGWTERLKRAGVRTDLFESMSDDYEWHVYEASVLQAARDSVLSDDDLYPLLVRLWTGTLPAVDWPPRAPSVARRCASALASRQRCEIDAKFGFPTEGSIEMVRDALIDELGLSVVGLLDVLAEHWQQLASMEMQDAGSSLFSFAEEMLLKPIVGACLQLWLVLLAPLPARRDRAAPRERDGWGEWSILSGDGWWDNAEAELIRLGHPRRVVADGDELAAQLADARAANHAMHGTTDPVAASIVRTSRWPGDPALIDSLAYQAVGLALARIGDIDPDADNDEIIDAMQCQLTPANAKLLEWLRDPSFGTLGDGCPRTGEEALSDAADWLTWRVCRDAVEFACAIGRPSAAAT